MIRLIATQSRAAQGSHCISIQSHGKAPQRLSCRLHMLNLQVQLLVRTTYVINLSYSSTILTASTTHSDDGETSVCVCVCVCHTHLFRRHPQPLTCRVADICQVHNYKILIFFCCKIFFISDHILYNFHLNNIGLNSSYITIHSAITFTLIIHFV